MESAQSQNFRFNIREFGGAIGDYGTLIPIVFGVVAVTDMQFGPILFFFGLSYIAAGLYYKLPMPVEPMKAIGAIAIAGNLNAMEVAGAGMLAGVILLVIGLTGSMRLIKNLVPESIIRGIQLGLALALLAVAWDFVAQDAVVGLSAIVVILAFTLLPVLDVSSLVVFAIGLVIGIGSRGLPAITFLSRPDLTIPSLSDFTGGFLVGTLPQLPLTLANSVLATSLLITDLFGREVSEDRIVTTVGVMSLAASPLGGFPMCHGAGGLAAQYRFGARTGGSNIISGVILLLIALFFASPESAQLIPYGILGALLFFTSLQLLKSSLKTDNKLFTLLTGLIAFFVNISAGFLIMLIVFWMKRKFFDHGED